MSVTLHHGLRCVVTACALAAGMVRLSSAQASAVHQTSSPEDARAKSLELRRQKLQSDIDDLVRMAASLKVMVDGVKKDELSMRVVREADRIERLAKSLKETAKQQ